MAFAFAAFLLYNFNGHKICNNFVYFILKSLGYNKYMSNKFKHLNIIIKLVNANILRRIGIIKSKDEWENLSQFYDEIITCWPNSEYTFPIADPDDFLIDSSPYYQS